MVDALVMPRGSTPRTRFEQHHPFAKEHSMKRLIGHGAGVAPTVGVLLLSLACLSPPALAGGMRGFAGLGGLHGGGHLGFGGLGGLHGGRHLGFRGPGPHPSLPTYHSMRAVPGWSYHYLNQSGYYGYYGYYVPGGGYALP